MYRYWLIISVSFVHQSHSLVLSSCLLLLEKLRNLNKNFSQYISENSDSRHLKIIWLFVKWSLHSTVKSELQKSDSAAGWRRLVWCLFLLTFVGLFVCQLIVWNGYSSCCGRFAVGGSDAVMPNGTLISCLMIDVGIMPWNAMGKI